MRAGKHLRTVVLTLVVAQSLVTVSCIWSAAAPENTALITKIIDGDTVVLSNGYSLRYIGIDTPERGQPYYQEASIANRDLVLGKRVKLERDISDTDKYSRLLRYVYSETLMVNLELVKQGWAYARAYPPDTRYRAYFEAVEAEAKIKKKGLWQDR